VRFYQAPFHSLIDTASLLYLGTRSHTDGTITIASGGGPFGEDHLAFTERSRTLDLFGTNGNGKSTILHLDGTSGDGVQNSLGLKCFFGFHFKWTNGAGLSGGQVNFLEVRDEDGVLHLALRLGTSSTLSNSLDIFRNLVLLRNATVLGYSSYALAQNKWHWIQFAFDISNTCAAADLYVKVDSKDWITFSAPVDTQNAGSPTQIVPPLLASQQGLTCRFANLVCNDSVAEIDDGSSE
jgi:hypothetical protein